MANYIKENQNKTTLTDKEIECCRDNLTIIINTIFNKVLQNGTNKN